VHAFERAAVLARDVAALEAAVDDMAVAALRADFVAWDTGHPRELAYRFGHAPCRHRVFGGVPTN
jgi:imidazolonepropionase